MPADLETLKPAGHAATLASSNPGTLCPPAPAPRHRAGSHCSQPPQNAPTFLPDHFPRQWNRACSNTTRFTRNFASSQHQSSASDRQRVPRRTLLQLLHRGTSMSISGILSSSLNHYQVGAPRTSDRPDFQQLSQDHQVSRFHHQHRLKTNGEDSTASTQSGSVQARPTVPIGGLLQTEPPLGRPVPVGGTEPPLGRPVPAGGTEPPLGRPVPDPQVSLLA